jgi:hypothetical protein
MMTLTGGVTALLWCAVHGVHHEARILRAAGAPVAGVLVLLDGAVAPAALDTRIGVLGGEYGGARFGGLVDPPR